MPMINWSVLAAATRAGAEGTVSGGRTDVGVAEEGLTIFGGLAGRQDGSFGVHPDSVARAIRARMLGPVGGEE